MISYYQAKEAITDLPMSWYPALLIHVVEEAIKKGVFKPGKIAEFVAKVEERFAKPPKTPPADTPSEGA